VRIIFGGKSHLARSVGRRIRPTLAGVPQIAEYGFISVNGNSLLKARLRHFFVSK
jgi:hypothetical protein